MHSKLQLLGAETAYSGAAAMKENAFISFDEISARIAHGITFDLYASAVHASVDFVSLPGASRQKVGRPDWVSPFRAGPPTEIQGRGWNLNGRRGTH